MDQNFEGFTPRTCGEHRTVGLHRAWCFDDSQWCYPNEFCSGCKEGKRTVNKERYVIIEEVRRYAVRVTVPDRVKDAGADSARGISTYVREAAQRWLRNGRGEAPGNPFVEFGCVGADIAEYDHIVAVSAVSSVVEDYTYEGKEDNAQKVVKK